MKGRDQLLFFLFFFSYLNSLLKCTITGGEERDTERNRERKKEKRERRVSIVYCHVTLVEHLRAFHHSCRASLHTCVYPTYACTPPIGTSYGYPLSLLSSLSLSVCAPVYRYIFLSMSLHPSIWIDTSIALSIAIWIVRIEQVRMLSVCLVSSNLFSSSLSRSAVMEWWGNEVPVWEADCRKRKFQIVNMKKQNHRFLSQPRFVIVHRGMRKCLYTLR